MSPGIQAARPRVKGRGKRGRLEGQGGERLCPIPTVKDKTAARHLRLRRQAGRGLPAPHLRAPVFPLVPQVQLGEPVRLLLRFWIHGSERTRRCPRPQLDIL